MTDAPQDYWIIEVYKNDGSVLGRQFVRVSDDADQKFVNMIANRYAMFKRTSVRRISEAEVNQLSRNAK